MKMNIKMLKLKKNVFLWVFFVSLSSFLKLPRKNSEKQQKNSKTKHYKNPINIFQQKMLKYMFYWQKY